MKPRIALLFLIMTIALGCGEDEGEGKPTGATCPTASTLTYETFGSAFMESYCLRCHSSAVTGADREDAPTDHNFDTLNEIKGLAEHIDENAGAGPDATNTLMPPDDPRPSLEQRMQLSAWLACGAP
jgi:uncharacterized membrane protein